MTPIDIHLKLTTGQIVALAIASAPTAGLCIAALWQAFKYLHSETLNVKDERIKQKDEAIAALKQQIKTPQDFQAELSMLQEANNLKSKRLASQLDEAVKQKESAVAEAVREKIELNQKQAKEISRLKSELEEAKNLRHKADEKLRSMEHESQFFHALSSGSYELPVTLDVSKVNSGFLGMLEIDPEKLKDYPNLFTEPLPKTFTVELPKNDKKK